MFRLSVKLKFERFFKNLRNVKKNLKLNLPKIDTSNTGIRYRMDLGKKLMIYRFRHFRGASGSKNYRAVRQKSARPFFLYYNFRRWRRRRDLFKRIRRERLFVHFLRRVFLIKTYKKYRGLVKKVKKSKKFSKLNYFMCLLESRLVVVLMRMGFINHYGWGIYLIKNGFIFVNSVKVTDVKYLVPEEAMIEIMLPMYSREDNFVLPRKKALFNHKPKVIRRRKKAIQKLYVAGMWYEPRPLTIYRLWFFAVPKVYRRFGKRKAYIRNFLPPRWIRKHWTAKFRIKGPLFLSEKKKKRFRYYLPFSYTGWFVHKYALPSYISKKKQKRVYSRDGDLNVKKKYNYFTKGKFDFFYLSANPFFTKLGSSLSKFSRNSLVKKRLFWYSRLMPQNYRKIFKGFLRLNHKKRVKSFKGNQGISYGSFSLSSKRFKKGQKKYRWRRLRSFNYQRKLRNYSVSLISSSFVFNRFGSVKDAGRINRFTLGNRLGFFNLNFFQDKPLIRPQPWSLAGSNLKKYKYLFVFNQGKSLKKKKSSQSLFFSLLYGNVFKRLERLVPLNKKNDLAFERINFIISTPNSSYWNSIRWQRNSNFSLVGAGRSVRGLGFKNLFGSFLKNSYSDVQKNLNIIPRHVFKSNIVDHFFTSRFLSKNMHAFPKSNFKKVKKFFKGPVKSNWLCVDDFRDFEIMSSKFGSWTRKYGKNRFEKKWLFWYKKQQGRRYWKKKLIRGWSNKKVRPWLPYHKYHQVAPLYASRGRFVKKRLKAFGKRSDSFLFFVKDKYLFNTKASLNFIWKNNSKFGFNKNWKKNINMDYGNSLVPFGLWSNRKYFFLNWRFNNLRATFTQGNFFWQKSQTKQIKFRKFNLFFQNFLKLKNSIDNAEGLKKKVKEGWRLKTKTYAKQKKKERRKRLKMDGPIPGKVREVHRFLFWARYPLYKHLYLRMSALKEPLGFYNNMKPLSKFSMVYLFNEYAKKNFKRRSRFLPFENKLEWMHKNVQVDWRCRVGIFLGVADTPFLKLPAKSYHYPKFNQYFFNYLLYMAYR